MSEETPPRQPAADQSTRPDGVDLTRRKLMVAGAATWASVGLAGCGDGNEEDGGDGTTTTTTAPTGDGDDGNGGGDGVDDDGTTTTTQPGDGGTTVTSETTTTTAPADGGDGTATTTACESIRQFYPGMEVGMIVSAFDSETGDALGGDAIEGVTIEFPDADFGPVDLDWSGPHEQYTDDGWGGKVVTDADAEPGTYTYEISLAGADGVVDTITDRFHLREPPTVEG